MSKYILHYGNLAGWPYYYAMSLRKMGINSISVKPVKEESGVYPGGVVLQNRRLPSDITLTKRSEQWFLKRFKRYSFFIKTLYSSNLIHYHGTTLIRNAYDALMFGKMNIPMIISWGGGDVRIVEKARKNNPYFYRENNSEWDKKVINRLETISKYVRFVATDPEMAEYSKPYFEKVFILKQPIDLNEGYLSIPDKKNIKPRILHIPTRPEVKGTEYIENAIQKLQYENFCFEYKKMKPNLTQKQVRRIIGTCDIYVDQLRCGSHGVTAVEAMASGKPTITFIRDDLIEKYPEDLPIVNANPDTIYNKLKMLIKDSELRHEIGIKSRKYIEKYHSLEVIGPKLLEIYREIGLKL